MIGVSSGGLSPRALDQSARAGAGIGLRDQHKIEADFFGPSAQAIKTGISTAALPSAERGFGDPNSDGQVALAQAEILAPPAQLDHQGCRQGHTEKT